MVDLTEGIKTMTDDQVQQIVLEVIRRLAPRLGADGRRGPLITVFTAATVAFSEAIQQVQSLIMDGFQIRLAFSQTADQLYGQTVRDQLSGFPHVSFVDSCHWLSSLKDARAVVIPLLSVNTASKISSLIADSLTTNLLLHALFMGKQVIVARDGADPVGPGRAELGFHMGSQLLQRALQQQLQTIAEYGCHLTDIERLRQTVNSVLVEEKPAAVDECAPSSHLARPALDHEGKVVTAAHVTSAHRLGADLKLREGSLITPLARELATKYGITLVMVQQP